MTHVMLIPAPTPPTPGCALTPTLGTGVLHMYHHVPGCAVTLTVGRVLHMYHWGVLLHTTPQPKDCYTCLLGTDVNPAVQTLLPLKTLSSEQILQFRRQSIIASSLLFCFFWSRLLLDASQHCLSQETCKPAVQWRICILMRTV